MTVIAILVGVGIISLTAIQNQAKKSRAREELETLKKAMLAYKSAVGELPPVGDMCSWCNPPCWTYTIDALVNPIGPNYSSGNDGWVSYSPPDGFVDQRTLGWSGPYLDKRIDTDPWGEYYLYDDNDISTCCGVASFIISKGPNKILDSGWIGYENPVCQGDDICIVVTNDDIW